MGSLENSTRKRVCKKTFAVEIDTKFQTLPKIVNVTIFTSPISQEDEQLVAGGTVIFVHILSTKYIIEAVLTAEKPVWFKSTAMREVIRK